MTQERFVRDNTPAWEELENLLRVSAPNGMTFQGLVRLHRLYRLAAGQLSYARDHFPESQITLSLNALVTRAHHRLHVRRSGSWRAFGRTLADKLPRTVKQNRAYVLTATGVFLAFGLYAYLMTRLSSAGAGAFLSPDLFDSEGGAGNWDSVMMASTIMVNNIYVAVLAFGLGLTLGLGTLYVLAQNGMMLGSLAAFFTERGLAVSFWSLILPHGIWELFAIFLAGAAGLRIGMALLRPGRLSRRDALLSAGRQAVSLMGMVCVLLVLAAVVEGFFTPSDLPPWAKLLFSGAAFALLSAYLFFGGRRRNAELTIDN